MFDKLFLMDSGSVVTNPSNTNNEDGSNRDDGQDIGVVGRGKLLLE